MSVQIVQKTTSYLNCDVMNHSYLKLQSFWINVFNNDFALSFHKSFNAKLLFMHNL